MTINKLLLAGTIGGAMMMASCTSFNPEKTAKQWDVVQLGSVQVAPGPNSPYLGFDSGMIYGFTGCNRINGGIEMDGSEFKATNVTTTMKFCPNAKFEQEFLKALNEAKEIKESEEGFELLNKEGNAIATFSPHALDPKEIEGQWLLTNMNGNEVEQNEETPFVIFDIKEKRFSGFTGCNRINTDIDLNALKNCTVDFTRMAMTRKMCQNNIFEADFVDVLNHANTVRISDNKLYVYSEDNDDYLVFNKE